MLRELVRKAGNHGHLPVKLCRQEGDHSDRPEHSACSPLPYYSHHSRSIPFFRRDSLGIRRTAREIDTETALQFPVRKISDFPCLPDLIPGLEQVEEDRLVHPLLA